MRKTGILIAQIGLLLLLGCKKQEGLAPAAKFASSSFRFVVPLTPKYETLDFGVKQKEHFYALFNESVVWKLTLKGNISNAVKTFQGFSNTIDSLDTIWEGTTDGTTKDLNLFVKEKVTVKLEILGYNGSILDTIEILSQHIYGYSIPNTNNDVGFESGSKSLSKFYAPSFDVGDVMTATVDSLFPTPQGKFSLFLDGIDKNKSYYVGGTGLNNQGKMKVPTRNADSLYFTILVYGNGPNNYAKLMIQFTEADGTNGAGDNNILEIVPNHVGWKPFSVRYSDLKVPPGYKVGNNIPNADDIRLVAFMLGTTDGMGRAVSVRIDYPIFTYGKPLYEEVD